MAHRSTYMPSNTNVSKSKYTFELRNTKGKEIDSHGNYSWLNSSIRTAINTGKISAQCCSLMKRYDHCSSYSKYVDLFVSIDWAVDFIEITINLSYSYNELTIPISAVDDIDNVCVVYFLWTVSYYHLQEHNLGYIRTTMSVTTICTQNSGH